MSKKITKDEYLKNIRHIINENMSDELDYVLKSDKFNITRYIVSLIESGQNDPKLMDFLMEWHSIVKQLPEGKEFTVYESFANGLSKYSKANAAVKNVLAEMQAMLDEFGHEYVIFNLIDQLSDPIVKEDAKMAYNTYLYEPTVDNRKEVIEAIWNEYEMNDPVALKLMEVLSDETNIKTPEIQYLSESTNHEFAAKLAKHREDRKIKRTQQKLEEYAKQVFENARLEKEAEKNKYNFGTIANNTGINLNEAIRIIVNSDAKSNKKLMSIIEQYAGALNNGLYEERLYETFLHKMSAFDYLNPVEKAINKINEAVKKNPVGIEITKIMEEMAESTSAYILPMIEQDCARFVKEPNPTNRVQVRNCLMAYSSDPYCYKILEIIDRDDSKANNTISEKALNAKDTIKLIREHATVTDLYSPVQYIKEGESVFFTNGQYFVRKGKTIAKLSEDGIAQLSEKFTTLCKLVNDPQVKVYENYILLTGTDKVARIYEGFVDINGIRESTATLRNLQEMCMKYDYDTNFFIMASCLHENFNKIAKIDFAKHIYLNENEGLNADIFRLGEQIFINTVNEDANSSTFFHNVNPIQCRNIINGHMGINVANLFENLLPNQTKIIMRLNETKEEYEASIDKLETRLDQLIASKEKCTDETSIKKLETGIKTVQDKLNDIKSEYKEWQKKAAEATGEDIDDTEDSFDDEEVNGDGEVKKETTNEPLTDADVEKAMDDLTTPIKGNKAEESTETEEGESLDITDDEFEEFLNDNELDAETEETSDEVEDTEDVDMESDEITDTEDEVDTVETEETTDEVEDVEDTEETSDETEDTEETTDEVEDVVDTEDTEFDSAIDAEINAALADNDEDDTVETEDDTELNDDDRIFGDDVIADEEPVETGDEDMGFDEVALDDDTIEDDTEVETDDEDIIIDGVEAETDKHTEDTAELTGDEATEEFGGDTEESVIDMETPNLPSGMEPEIDLIAKITNVMFDENIKTGVKYRTGTVNAIVPMVDKTGKMYNDNQTYTFYLDSDGRPVIDNEDMPYSLYDAIIKKIQAEPSYEVFNKEGVENNTDAVTEKPETFVNVTDDIIKDTDDENMDDSEVSFDSELDNEIFNTTDTGDTFTVTVKDDFEDIPEIDFEDDEKETTFSDEDDKTIADMVKAIPTYTDGETEIELPAANVDDTVIPEKHVIKTSAKKVNEGRKIKGIGSVLSTNKGTRFFVNEDTAKSSKSLARFGTKLMREKFSGSTELKDGFLIEEYNGYNNDLKELRSLIIKNVNNHYKSSIKVSRIYDIYEYDIEGLDLQFFNIMDRIWTNQSFTVYALNNKLYYRHTDEFDDCIRDTRGEVPAQLEALLEMTYDSDEPLQPINMKNSDAVVSDIINSLLAITNDINEHAKIRRAKLHNDKDFLNSKMADDILHGDKEQRDFEEQIEKDTQAAGVENPLAPSAPATEESVKPKLPNVHRMSLDEAKNFEIIYEPDDHVLYKNNKGKVLSIQEDGKVNVDVNGKTIVAEPKDLEPDPDYVNDLDIIDSEDSKPSLNKTDNDNLNDLNKKTVDCNIVIDGQQLNIHECYAMLSDIINCKKQIRVINENGDTAEYEINNIEFTEWPYAVIVNGDGEPLRKIQINPQSYINASEDDYVECLVAGKQSQYLKRVINILS